MPLVRRLGWPGGADAEPRPRHISDLALGDQGVTVVERYRGGAGDLICARPAIQALRERYPDYRMILHFPEQYRDLLADLGDEFYNYREPEQSLLYCEACELSGPIKHLVYYHLFCPCGVHELETDGRPTECRIDNFCRLVGAQGRRPNLAHLADDEFAWDSGGLPVVGIQLRTATRAKEWPTGHWVTTIRALQDRCRFVAFDDGDMTQKRLADVGLDWGRQRGRMLAHAVTVCAGQSWGETLTQAAACNAFLVPDSAMLHIAGALGKPFVGMFGPTDGKLTLTYYPEGEVIQGWPNVGTLSCHAPCYYHESNTYRCAGVCGECMVNLRPEPVIEAVERLL